MREDREKIRAELKVKNNVERNNCNTWVKFVKNEKFYFPERNKNHEREKIFF